MATQTQLGFYFDQTRCINCYTCVVACKDWNDVPAGPVSWRRVYASEQGKYPDLSVSFLSTTCYHCAKPECVPACPASAIRKRPDDGIVVVDREACLGKDQCELCREVCMYDAPQFGAEKNARMQKCDLCLDRWSGGKPPICVAACPTRALDAGPMEDLEAKYGSNREAIGFMFSTKLKPSVLFKSKRSGPRPGGR